MPPPKERLAYNRIFHLSSLYRKPCIVLCSSLNNQRITSLITSIDLRKSYFESRTLIFFDINIGSTSTLTCFNHESTSKDMIRKDKICGNCTICICYQVFSSYFFPIGIRTNKLNFFTCYDSDILMLLVSIKNGSNMNSLPRTIKSSVCIDIRRDITTLSIKITIIVTYRCLRTIAVILRISKERINVSILLENNFTIIITS